MVLLLRRRIFWLTFIQWKEVLMLCPSLYTVNEFAIELSIHHFSETPMSICYIQYVLYNSSF